MFLYGVLSTLLVVLSMFIIEGLQQDRRVAQKKIEFERLHEINWNDDAKYFHGETSFIGISNIVIHVPIHIRENK